MDNNGDGEINLRDLVYENEDTIIGLNTALSIVFAPTLAVTLTGGNSITFTDGYANSELDPDSGNVIYIENRKPISRASDQTEDIKLIVEF